MVVSGIEWDTDGIDADELGLPTEIILDANAEGISDHEKLADWMSDRYGWTVSAYSCEPRLERCEPTASFTP